MCFFFPFTALHRLVTSIAALAEENQRLRTQLTGPVSATSVATVLENYRKDYDETLKEARQSVAVARNQEKIIEDLMKENKLLRQINDKVQCNFDDLVWEQSTLSDEHQAEKTRLGEVHAAY